MVSASSSFDPSKERNNMKKYISVGLMQIINEDKLS
jgi:hypothetical protein